MQKHVSYESAIALRKLCFDEYTEDLYLFARVGIRVECTHTDGNKTERTFHQGDLCQRDPDWAITYPSENWIPAPFVFDVVIYSVPLSLLLSLKYLQAIRSL